LAGFFVNDLHNKLEARTPAFLKHPLCQIHEEAVAASTEDDPDGGNILLFQVAGRLVSDIVHFLHHGQHPAARCGIHILTVVQHTGYRGNADP
jgi:hypothetical protein